MEDYFQETTQRAETIGLILKLCGARRIHGLNLNLKQNGNFIE
jgi:hypothetical protein